MKIWMPGSPPSLWRELRPPCSIPAHIHFIGAPSRQLFFYQQLILISSSCSVDTTESQPHERTSRKHEKIRDAIRVAHHAASAAARLGHLRRPLRRLLLRQAPAFCHHFSILSSVLLQLPLPLLDLRVQRPQEVIPVSWLLEASQLQ